VRNRPATLLLAALSLTVAVLIAGPAEAAPLRGSSWTHRLSVDLSRGDLGLPAGARPSALGRAALRRVAPRLGLKRSLGGVRLARVQRLPAGRGKLLRYQQTAGGRRIVWSQIDVAIASGSVRSIGATVVPVDGGRLAGRNRIGRGRALAIARRAVPGAEEAGQPTLIAYAGKPGAGAALAREPRLAFVVETVPRSRLGDESPTPVCIVVDAQTGRVLARSPSTCSSTGATSQPRCRATPSGTTWSPTSSDT
jgi:hypothetical protein